MRRLDWLLIALLFVLVVTVGVILLVPRLVRPGGSVEAPVAVSNKPAIPETLTAKSAYDVARPLARAWAVDAVLVSGQATWQADSAFQYEDTSWGFVFYSPSRVATALVTVTAENAHLLTSSRTEQEVQPAGLEQWQADSPAVVENILNHGGVSFLQQAGQATFVLTLNLNGDPTWRGRMIDKESGQTLTVLLDVETGEVTEADQTQ